VIALLARRAAFRRLFGAHVVSRSGDAFNTVALVVLVLRLTGSGTGVAGAVGLEVLPVLLFGPVAGVVVDRVPRRRVMLVADVARALVAVAIAIGHDSLAVVYGGAFGLALGSVAFNPAAAALLPETVEDDEIVDANAALWTSAVVAQIALAPLAGVVVAWRGPGGAFALNAVSYGVSALMLRGLPAAMQPADAVPRTGWSGVTAGAAEVRADPLLARLAVVQVLAALSAGATGGLLVVLATERFGVGPSGFGLLLGAVAAGAASAPLLGRRHIRIGRRAWLFGPYALRGAVDLTLATVTNPYAAGIALFGYGTATATGTIAYNSTLQARVGTDVRGRVFAFYDVLWSGSRLVSLGLGGLLADAAGIRAVYVAGGLLLLAASAVGASPTRPRRDPE